MGSVAYERMTAIFGTKGNEVWSAYATELYTRLRDRARREGWVGKLRFLLYEDRITAKDAEVFRGLEGVLLQSKPTPSGQSKNKHFQLPGKLHPR